MVAKHHHLEGRRSEHTPLGQAYHNSSTMRRRLSSSTTTNIKKTIAMVVATMTMGVVTIRAMEDKIKVTADNMMTGITREALPLRITRSKTIITPDPTAAVDPLLDLLDLLLPVPVEVDRLCKEAELGLVVRCALPQTIAEVLRLLIRRVVAATLRARDGVIRLRAPVGGQVLQIEL